MAQFGRVDPTTMASIQDSMFVYNWVNTLLIFPIEFWYSSERLAWGDQCVIEHIAPAFDILLQNQKGLVN